MKKLLCFSLFILHFSFFAGETAKAQELFGVTDFYDVVRNPVEYRRVLDKFAAGVERPSIRECVIAYYGFALQDGFSAEAAIPGEAEMQQAIMERDFERAFRLGNAILEHAPVNLSAIYWTLVAATEIKQSWEVRNALKAKYNNITYTIARSGNGISVETAFKVIWSGDMYTYTTQELNLAIGNGYLLDGHWTEFEVTPSQRFKYTSIFFELWNGGNGRSGTN
jgi:hypothetical protein